MADYDHPLAEDDEGRQKVRASMGTLGVLGMELVLMPEPPTTAYLQVYSSQRCKANCQFCSQARDASGRLKCIAQGLYVPAELNEVIRRLSIAYSKGYIDRVCIQTIMINQLWERLLYLIRRLTENCAVPISVSVYPLSDTKFETLRSLGVDKLVIPLDACNEALFEKIKGSEASGPFRWARHLEALLRASTIFGTGNVGTHLIIGLGETEEDALRLIWRLETAGIYTALFAYTLVSGAQIQMVKPSKNYYRRIQLFRELFRAGKLGLDDLSFADGVISAITCDWSVFEHAIDDGTAFITSGCPACNRPYATESPSDVYNYPVRPAEHERAAIIEALGPELKALIQKSR